jgi:GntR family transcriptional regulator
MTANIDHSSALPLHKQIEVQLRKLIDSEEYNNGKLFPKEVDLSNRFGVSRNTVRQAISTLVSEGLLLRKKGVGTTVSENRISTELSEWYSFTHEMNSKGIPFKNYKISLINEEVDEDVASIFNIKEGKAIEKLERVRGDIDGPFVYFISWFSPRISFCKDQDFTKPLYDILEEQFSIVPVKSSEELIAILADAKISKYLDVEVDSPILLRKRKVYDMGNRIVEYNLGYYRADKFTYKIDINRSFK